MLYLSLLIFWLILNGKVTLELVIVGCIISVAVTKFTYKHTRNSPATERKLLKVMGKALHYIVVLFVEVVKANIGMLQMVLTPNLKYEPAIYITKIPIGSRFSRVAVGNSITLTPGTIIVKLDDDDVYYVHSVDKPMLEGTEESIFVEMCQDIEEEIRK